MGDACIRIWTYHTSYVETISDSVKWTGHATKTLRVHAYFPKYNEVIRSKTLTKNAGWHGWSWAISSYYPYVKFCAGATNTPGFPCITIGG
jgi:hypothetical protein